VKTIDPYPQDRLYEEVAFLSYYFNWPREEVLGIPHWERQRWCQEISSINRKKNSSDADSEGLGLEPDPRVDDIPIADLGEF